MVNAVLRRILRRLVDIDSINAKAISIAILPVWLVGWWAQTIKKLVRNKKPVFVDEPKKRAQKPSRGDWFPVWSRSTATRAIFVERGYCYPKSSQLVAPTLDPGSEQVLQLRWGQLILFHIREADLYDHKLDLIKKNAERLGVAVQAGCQKGWGPEFFW